jgi:hypothetical protein
MNYKKEFIMESQTYQLGEVEEIISEMDMSDIPCEIVKINNETQLIISGYSIYIESLNLSLKEGEFCVWNNDEKAFIPDFSVTIIYDGKITDDEWLYYEQDGFTITLANWLNSNLLSEYAPLEQIGQLQCEIIIPEKS